MNNRYSKFIKSLRIEVGYSQAQVAKELGISRASYIAVEQGKRDLSLKEAVFASELLGITLDELYLGGAQKYEKYKQMFFAFLRAIKGDGKIPKTKLAKLLYLADFGWYYNNMQSMSGLQYRKIEHGPVPDYYFRLIEELDGDGKISLQAKGSAILVSETRIGEKVGENLLSATEKQLIKKIAKKWEGKKTKEIVDFAHDQLPYVFADKGAIIPYELITQEDPGHVY